MILTAVIVPQIQMSMGREFHSLGAHEQNALSPYKEKFWGTERRSFLTI